MSKQWKHGLHASLMVCLAMTLAACDRKGESGESKQDKATAVVAPDRSLEYVCESDDDCVLSTFNTQEDHAILYCCDGGVTYAMNKKFEADYRNYCQERPGGTDCPNITRIGDPPEEKVYCDKNFVGHPKGKCHIEQPVPTEAD